MQVVILSGGRGSRLSPLTNNVPKAMVLLKGKPFLGYLLERLKSCRLKNILILSGHLGEQIEDFFGDGARFGLSIAYSREKEALGTAGALKKAEKRLEKSFLLLYGDTYLDLDYRDLIRRFCQYATVGMIAVYANPDKIAVNNMRVGTGMFVEDYNKKDGRGMNYLDSGAMVFKKEVTDFIEKDKVSSLENDIYPRLIAAKAFVAYPMRHRFYDIGSFAGLKLLSEKLR
jgi:NDP-sugar pyrophosphorylase family protein